MAAGIAFALSGIATKLVTDTFSSGQYPTALLWVGGLVATAALLGGVAEMSSLQVGRASRVIPITFPAAPSWHVPTARRMATVRPDPSAPRHAHP
jgi:hypothetical protein